jgi:ankyrin repeat protein
MAYTKKSVRKSPKKSVRKVPKKSPKKSLRKSPKKSTKKSLRKAPKKTHRLSYRVTDAIPMDIWINLFESSSVKEKIRILSINKDIREHIYAHYGGKDVVEKIIKDEKKEVESKYLKELMQSKPEEIEFEYVVDILKEYDLDVNEFVDKKTGETILIKAAQTDDEDSVKDLIKLGATVDARDKRSRTALMYACFGFAKKGKRGSYRVANDNIVEELLENGANPDATNDEGETAVEYAMELKDPSDVLDLLQDAGADEDRIEAAYEELRDRYD